VTNPNPGTGLTGLGKLISILLVVGLIALGGWIVTKKIMTPAQPTPQQTAASDKTVKILDAHAAPADNTKKLDPGELLADPQHEVPTLAAPIPYLPKNNIIDIELSRYAGYSGLIVANGGLEPNPDSYFAKTHGFQVHITLSEAESWNALNAGKMAASATTADVLAVYGRSFHVTCPAQIGYSRGADGLVVQSDVHRFNQLKGKIVAAVQFTESDFFVRYLAREAGIDVKILDNLNASSDPQSINLLYCKDGESVGQLMQKDLDNGTTRIAGGMTWAPTTTDLVAASNGKLRLLTTNKNLLIIADVLIVNRGFADKNPDKVAALVDGLLAGNKMVRENPEQHWQLLANVFSAKDDKWDHARTLAELQKVHLSNLPENLAFFSGGITAGGSFASIYQSSVLAYGPQILPNPVDSDRFLDPAGLDKAKASGKYKDQVAAIVPITASSSAPIETDPLLSKDIRFLFEPNSDRLNMSDKGNLENLNAIKRMLDVSPGSSVLLRGHVDNASIPKFRKEGGESLVRTMALEAMELSKRRADEIKRLLVDREKIEPKRIKTVGRGWEEPAGTDSDANRRVEVQWFTLE
jgi:NitT/TauT family transport system substrate-binding protein